MVGKGVSQGVQQLLVGLLSWWSLGQGLGCPGLWDCLVSLFLAGRGPLVRWGALGAQSGEPGGLQEGRGHEGRQIL